MRRINNSLWAQARIKDPFAKEILAAMPAAERKRLLVFGVVQHPARVIVLAQWQGRDGNRKECMRTWNLLKLDDDRYQDAVRITARLIGRLMVDLDQPEGRA